MAEIFGNQPTPAGALERVIPFFAFPEEVRKVVYTTNAVESLNMSLPNGARSAGVRLRRAKPARPCALCVVLSG